MAGLEVAGWFAPVIIDQLVGKARTFFGGNRDLNGSIEDMLSRLEIALPQIQSVVSQAEKRPIRDRSLAQWLRQFKDSEYEVEDVLDDLEAKKLQEDKKGKSKVSKFVASSFESVKHFLPSDKDLKNLQNVLKKLDIIASGVGNFTQLLTLEAKVSKHETLVSKEESSLSSGEILIGRDNEKEAILEMLSNLDVKPKSHGKLGVGSSSGLGLQVIPIVGIGGVGKTALARLIYNAVEDPFMLKTWVYVSDNHDTNKLTVQMLENFVACSFGGATASDFSIRKHPISGNVQFLESLDYNRRRLGDFAASFSNWKRPISAGQSLDYYQRALRHFVVKKKFFIVLDDVWDETGALWETLRSPLINTTDGGVVLVTTQSQRTAEIIGTVTPIVLDVLEESEYWKLLEHFAFGDKMIEETKRRELQSIGREIATKLQGLPLAGKVMGTLLKSNLNVDYWRRLENSEWWEIDGLERILPSLRLSFQHLSANLRQCFAYCSIFPKGYIFEKERLVQMWMAQGFIQPDERNRWRMEDIGIEWFDELTSRSFFQPIWNNQYIMHDWMRELVTYVSSEECFILKDDSQGIPSGLRHLSIKTDSLDVLNANVDKLTSLRTILFFGDYKSQNFVDALNRLFKKSRSLRVLDLSYSTMAKRQPLNVDGLSHLRYFDLSYTKYPCLSSVTRLFHLQVLNLRECQFSQFPYGISSLINLRHLYGDGDTLSLIAGIGKLTRLQELGEFHDKGRLGHRIGELKHLEELQGSLSISGLQNVVSKNHAMEAMLHNKKHLHSLQLEWTSLNEITSSTTGNYILQLEWTYAQEILEGLQPHPNLKGLVIKNYGGITSSSWMVDGQCLSYLQSLYLINCKHWNCLPPIGQLQFLKVLHLVSMSSIHKVDGRVYGDSEVVFPSLEELVLSDMSRCTEWTGVAQDHQLFPRLCKLHIINCRALKKFPLCNLKSSILELKIQDCGDLESALPQPLQNLTSLKILEIEDLSILASLMFHENYIHETSLDLHNLIALQKVNLCRSARLRLVEGLYSLASLKVLTIRGCPKLTLAPPPTQQLDDPGEESSSSSGQTVATRFTSLTHLDIDGRFLTNQGCLAFGKLPKLRVLNIFHYPLREFGDEQIEWFLHLTSLQHLSFIDSRDLVHLPPVLHMHPSLNRLSICGCPAIPSLPMDGLPPSLKTLDISECPTLKDRCQKERGLDWPKICHIPYIRIDNKTIQML